MSSIKYLIKLLKEEEFIDTLINNGEMFMRPAKYFIDLERTTQERGQGDIRENIMFDSVRVCSDYPIYCMYSVLNSDVCDEGILINKKFIDTFSEDKNGYFALIDFDTFMKKITSHFDGNI